MFLLTLSYPISGMPWHLHRQQKTPGILTVLFFPSYCPSIFSFFGNLSSDAQALFLWEQWEVILYLQVRKSYKCTALLHLGNVFEVKIQIWESLTYRQLLVLTQRTLSMRMLMCVEEMKLVNISIYGSNIFFFQRKRNWTRSTVSYKSKE